MTIFRAFLLSVILFTSLISAQDTGRVAVKIGNISITEKELNARYQLTPRLNANQKSTGNAAKTNLLYGLIAEKLLANDARNLQLDTAAVVQYNLKNFEKMFVRDALYKKEVIDKAKATGDSLLSYYIEHASTAFTKSIISDDEKGINNIYNLLMKGVPFDSIYSGLQPEEKDTFTIVRGEFNENLENVLLKIPEGSISKPMLLDSKWRIFYVVRSVNAVLAKAPGWEQEYKRIQKTAQGRAEKVFYKNFMQSFFAGKEVKANGFMIASFADKISRIFKEKEKAGQDSTVKFILTAADIYNIEQQYGDSLEAIFIKLPGEPVKLKDFIRFFITEQFIADKSDFQPVASLLNSKNKKFIEYELLAREGYRQNLQNDPEVKQEAQMWQDNYLYQLMHSYIGSSVNVTDDDVRKYYSEKYNAAQNNYVRIVEVLTDNIEIADTVLNELNKGVDIHVLAKKYSQREWTKESRGDFGYFPVTMYGGIGQAAAGMKVGEICGPLKVPEGYSIFKLTDRKEENVTPPPFEQVKEGIQKELFNKKVNDALVNKIVELAKASDIQINNAAVDDIKDSNINVVVFQYLGFGGRLTAVPYITPQTEWVKPWRKTINKEL